MDPTPLSQFSFIKSYRLTLKVNNFIFYFITIEEKYVRTLDSNT